MLTPIDATGHPGATTALLNGGADFVMADLWTITLNGGAVVRWHGAGFNTPLSFNGNTWSAGPAIDRGKITTKLGVDVATLDATITAGPGDLINGVPILPFVRGNGLDGATVVLYRAYLPAWSQPIAGVTIAFSGRVTSLKNLSRSQFQMTVSAWTVLLNVNMGPDVYQAGCLNTLYDANCTLNKASFAFSATVTGGGTTTACDTSLTQADGFFTQGELVWTSGANAGLSRAVATYVNAAGALTFAFPLPTAPAPGDAFTAYRGCNLTMAACTAFNNLIHFRGQPFTPPAVTGAVGVGS
jgi:uncharacterized phage protein (TIGR02218 family)